MSCGLSTGDIILCCQITHRLFTAVTTGRKNAPRDLRELQDTLFGLNCSLGHLQRASAVILARPTIVPGCDAGDIQKQVGFMIRSCRQTLEGLESATAKYRDAVDESSLVYQNRYTIAGIPVQQVTAQVKMQWRRFMWDFKGDSLSRYRRKLQSHTDAINLLLNTFIWYVSHCDIIRVFD